MACVGHQLTVAILTHKVINHSENVLIREKEAPSPFQNSLILRKETSIREREKVTYLENPVSQRTMIQPLMNC